MNKSWRNSILKHFPEIILILLILTLAAYLRVTNLRTNPDWYQDEGEFIEITKGLLSGKFEYMGLQGSMLFIGRPPTYFLILVEAFKLFGEDIVVLRGFSVVCSLLTILFVYLTARKPIGKVPAIFGSLFLSILPEEILYNRIGLTYNLLALLFLITAYISWQYLLTRKNIWVYLTAIVSGLALAIDFLGIIPVFFVLGLVISTQPKQLVKIILLIFSPLFLVMLPLFPYGKRDMLYDFLTFFQTQGSGGNFLFNLIQFLTVGIAYYGNMISQNTWVVIGFLSMFILPERNIKVILISISTLILIIFPFVRNIVAHYLLPLWPFIAISLGYLLARGIPVSLLYLKKIFQAYFSKRPTILKFNSHMVYSGLISIISVSLVFFLAITPFIWLFLIDVIEFLPSSPPDQSLVNRYYFSGFASASDIEEIVSYLSSRLSTKDMVVASAHIGWPLPAQLINFNILLKYEETQQYIGTSGFNTSRFIGDISIRKMKYAIIDNSWRDWYIDKKGAKEVLHQIENWPMVFSKGSLDVYCNPSVCN